MLALAALSACNLAGDVTPPPGAATSPPGPAESDGSEAPVRAEPPLTRPDPLAGEVIYAERCAPCHGVEGDGDGPQSADLPVAPAALADPALAGSATPQEWYEVVTEGRMDRFMPPFASLSDQQRWDVVAYAISLSLPPLETAQELFEAQCVECHGEAGAGPGLEAPAFFAARSREDLELATWEGVGKGMPAFGGELDEQDLETLAAYVQSLAFDMEGPASDRAAEPEPPQAAAEEATVFGQVLNGESGAGLPEPLTVTLHAFDGRQQVLTEQKEVGPEGRFSFSELEVVSGRLYVVSADYQGVRYTSQVGHIAEADEPTELSLTVYESTSDPKNVVARRLHVLMDRPTENAFRVVELWILVNEGEKTVVPLDGEGGIELALPAEASNLRFEDSLLAERYLPTDRGFKLNSPLRPGGEGAQVVFSFELPLRGASEFVQPLTVPLQAATVLVAEGGPRVSGAGVLEAGSRSAAGEQFQQYDVAALDAGETLRLQLEGPPFWQHLLPQSLDARWAVGFVVFVVAVAAIAWWYRPWIAGEGALEAEDDVQRVGGRRRSLLQAIADLDDAYERGEVEETAYRHRRQELKSELIMLAERLDD